MNREDVFFVSIGVLFFALCAWIAWYSNTPEVKAQRERDDYARNFPCINGVRYIRSGGGGKESLTVMIDPKRTDSMSPQLCGAEAGQ